MGSPKVAFIAYCLAIGFILIVAFHPSSKTPIVASAPAAEPVTVLK